MGWCTVQLRISRAGAVPSSGWCGVRSGKRFSRSRPTMPLMIRSSVVSGAFTSSVSMVRPSRRMVTESATRRISFSLCEMMIEVMPCFFSSRIRSRSLPLSSSFSAAVGSSRISSFTFFDSAFAISTSCCLPTPMSATRVSGWSSSPTRRSTSVACLSVSFQLMNPRVACSLPRKMFSARERYGTSASSWWMMTMPRCSLARMSLKRQTSPSKRISPS
ncbi:hypothetical protein SALBM217S_07078 [Streptomyces griseoloalbus]